MWIRAAALAALLCLSAGDARASEQPRTYRASQESFPNPERGPVRSYDDALSEPLEDVRDNDVTVVRSTFRLDDYRETGGSPGPSSTV